MDISNWFSFLCFMASWNRGWNIYSLEQERRLKRKKAGELDKAEATASTEYKKSKQYVGYNYQGMGKRSGFGRGALGGYSKYI